MTERLRIHVDPDKCQGHARCKALAPELFELDEYGNAHEAGDGTVPPRPRRQGLACQIQLSGNRNRRDRGVAHRLPPCVPFLNTSP
ncbi:ferredoxin [Bradyrhizobium sp. LM6.10]